jgi:hypothetical protein
LPRCGRSCSRSARSASTTISSIWAGTRCCSCAPMPACANNSETACRSWRCSSIRRYGPWLDTWQGLTRSELQGSTPPPAPAGRRTPSHAAAP